MAKLTKEDFISALKEMSILEIKELVDAMKEEFGVDPSAVAVAVSTFILEDVAICLEKMSIDGTLNLASVTFVIIERKVEK